MERDERGAPVTRWDGETMKTHPVTGKPVPDEAARAEVYRYVNPKAATWPKADFIIGNPPFIGGKDVREKLGGGYFEALFLTTNMPESADFVMHWWDKAALAVRKGGARRFGFVTTNSITQTFSRRVVAKHLDAKDRVSLVFAIANHPWVDEKNGAAVRIAMSVAELGTLDGTLLSVINEVEAPESIEMRFNVGCITSNLRIGADITSCRSLRANLNLAHQGVKLHGDGFIIDGTLARSMIERQPVASAVIRPFRNGQDITTKLKDRYAIDLFGRGAEEARRDYPEAYQHIYVHVKPERDLNRREIRKRNWWLFGETVPALRNAISGLHRYIATVRTSKHRTFVFLNEEVLPESRLVSVASNDGFMLAVLSSKLHVLWTLAWGTRLGKGDDPNYNNSECFDPFPFPADVPEPLKARIRAEAEALDAQRKRVLAEHPDLTLTKLYNVLEALRAADRGGPALSDKDRDVHDRGLVTLIRQHHDAIDDGVADAYGWGDDYRAGTLDDETILTRLVALNAERAGEETRGLIRYLRPDYQDPGYRVPVSATLDLGEAAIAPVSNVILWPASLPEQVGAVQAILAAAARPMAAQDVARTFKGKRAGTVRPVLDALAGVGLARRLTDGRYAA